MPWFKTDSYIPPVNKEIWILFKDGHREKRRLEDVEVYDGIGGLNKNCPTRWANPDVDNLPDPVEEESPFNRQTEIVEKHDKA